MYSIKNGLETCSDLETAEAFNRFYESVFTIDNGHDPGGDTSCFKQPEEGFNDFMFNPEDVFNVLNSLVAAKASGPDEVDSALLKNCAEELKHPLYKLFRKSLDTSKIPTQWKRADISPIHKKGPGNIMNNYRPVNLTSNVSKAFESIFGDKLFNYLYLNSLISNEQHGFVKGRNCQTNILLCKEDWTRALDEDDSIDVIYFDYEKAFDKVNHRLLLKKLEWYGVGGKALEWIKQFLTDRTQRVKIGNSKSGWRSVLSSVVQGSVLGVKLFVTYINDLPHTCIKRTIGSPSADESLNDPKVKLLADDTKAYIRIRKGKEDEDSLCLQKVVDEIISWTDTWQMKIHPDKTKVLHIGPDNPRHVYKINNIQISQTELQRDIGFQIPENLSTSDHIQNSRAKALREIGIIRRTFNYLDKNSFKILFNQKVRTHLEWGSAACPPQTKAEALALDRVQNKATYLVKNLQGLSSEERREKLGLFQLEYRRLRGDLIEVYKIVHGFTNIDYNLLWEVRDSRNGPTLVKDQIGPTRVGHGRKLRESFFSYRVIKPWNWLTKDLKTAPSIDAFKRGLDALMDTDRWRELMQQL